MPDTLSEMFVRLTLDKERLQGDAAAAGKAFEGLAAKGIAGLKDLEARPRLIALALRALADESEATGAALAKVQAGRRPGSEAGPAVAGTAQPGPQQPSGGALASLTAPFTAAIGAATRFAAVLVGPVTAGLGKVASGAAQIGQAVQSAFGGAISAITGLARAGLAGTTMGERLGLQFQLLSREVASLFIPVLNRVINVLQTITGWFRQLSGPQQAFIGYVVSAGVALTAMGAILPRIISSLQGVGVVLKVLAANPIVAIVGAIAALLVGTEQGRGALGRLTEAFAPIISVVGKLATALEKPLELLGKIIGFLADAVSSAANFIAGLVEGVTDFLGLTSEAQRQEERAWQGQNRGQRGEGQDRHELANTTRGNESLAASFTRFQTAALRTSSGPEERTARASEQTNVLLASIAGALGQPAPAPVS